jgi:hypothetical protein
VCGYHTIGSNNQSFQQLKLDKDKNDMSYIVDGNPMQTLIFSEIAPQRNSNFFDWDHC